MKTAAFLIFDAYVRCMPDASPIGRLCHEIADGYQVPVRPEPEPIAYAIRPLDPGTADLAVPFLWLWATGQLAQQQLVAVEGIVLGDARDIATATNAALGEGRKHRKAAEVLQALARFAATPAGGEIQLTRTP